MVRLEGGESGGTFGGVGCFQVWLTVFQQKRTIQVALDKRAINNGDTFIQCFFNISIGHVIVLAGTEGAGVHFVEVSAFLCQFLFEDGDQHRRSVVANGFSESSLAVEAAVWLNRRFFGTFHEGAEIHFFYVYLISQDQDGVGSAVMCLL